MNPFEHVKKSGQTGVKFAERMSRLSQMSRLSRFKRDRSYSTTCRCESGHGGTNEGQTPKKGQGTPHIYMRVPLSLGRRAGGRKRKTARQPCQMQIDTALDFSLAAPAGPRTHRHGVLLAVTPRYEDTRAQRLTHSPSNGMQPSSTPPLTKPPLVTMNTNAHPDASRDAALGNNRR
jgi:hypothetical protein